LKWDAFIGRKGGMNNTLAPLKNSTNTNVTSVPTPPSSSLHTELSRPPKLDAITPGKREEIEERPQSPTPEQQQQRKVEDHQHIKDEEAKERPQSPTPEQQQQRKVEDHQHIEDEEAKDRNILKGKPIIFVGGGPGTETKEIS
jgi:hypothetical protein